MFLSEWPEFPSAPCLAKKKKNLDDISRLDFVEIASVPDMLPRFFLPGRAKDLSVPRYISLFKDLSLLRYCRYINFKMEASFLVGLRTYQHPGTYPYLRILVC